MVGSKRIRTSKRTAPRIARKRKMTRQPIELEMAIPIGVTRTRAALNPRHDIIRLLSAGHRFVLLKKGTRDCH
ncbi:hypothetical protein SAMN05518846_11693 [Brevibacillus centrosporus]|uniref:Uncharacterized protein n=1 Tax=Brevibacillus centrosporus TaxID=54910 RepID=A0A1I4B1T1_9BACL|nr:hypothetical protein SAMN05518846_11693 [Brevibacillus centrosporus]